MASVRGDIRKRCDRVLGTAHRWWQKATRNEGISSDAALKIVHLAPSQRIVVSTSRAIVVYRPAIIGREDEEQVVPHALSLEQPGGRRRL